MSNLDRLFYRSAYALSMASLAMATLVRFFESAIEESMFWALAYCLATVGNLLLAVRVTLKGVE